MNPLRRTLKPGPGPPDHLFLVGYRCTGKTSVGQRLAQRLRCEFADCDQRVAAGAGMSIAEIVSREGWTGFRQRERRALKDLVRSRRCVVATGGGVVGDAANRWDLRHSGVVVWLCASTPVIAARMLADSASGHQRPALSDAPLALEISRTLAARIPLYAAAAHFHVFTDNRSIDAVCDTILIRLSRLRAQVLGAAPRRCHCGRRPLPPW